jgi:putative Ca2+/H+ antiporter (TMEM165/GDT1 family)
MAAVLTPLGIPRAHVQSRNVGETTTRSAMRAFGNPKRVAVQRRRSHPSVFAAVADAPATTAVARRPDVFFPGEARFEATAPRATRDETVARATRPALALAGLASFAALGGVDPAHAADLAASSLESADVGGSLTDGFLSAFLLIFFSEIGDKTFFIAVLLATQQSKSSVFAGTFGALAVMTVISVAIGQAFHVAEEASGALLATDVPWDDYLAVALLLFFGAQTLLSAEEETAEEEAEDAKVAVAGMTFDGQTALILSTFALVFAAEWGDKSFIATIALSAAASPVGVAAGGAAGHGVATGIAVVLGDVLKDVVSERVVKYTGGTLFILFAIATALDVQS